MSTSDIPYQLFTYFRSTAAYRVRITLNLKKIPYQSCAVHLLKNGGENYLPDYMTINPQAMVPSLVINEDSDGNNKRVLTQSIAIIEYLDDRYPSPRILPEEAYGRAWVRSLAQMIACDIHPLNNLRVLDYLQQPLNLGESDKNTWYRHWVYEGFNALETLLSQQVPLPPFCYGDRPTLADICLIPQVFNAKRWQCDLTAYPIIRKVYVNCMAIQAFIDAAPENQPDAETLMEE